MQSVREGGDKGCTVALNGESIMGVAFRNLAENVVVAVEERIEDLPPTQKVEVTR